MLSLTALFLRWCSQVRDFGLQHLCSMRNLQILSLAGNAPFGYRPLFCFHPHTCVMRMFRHSFDRLCNYCGGSSSSSHCGRLTQLQFNWLNSCIFQAALSWHPADCRALSNCVTCKSSNLPTALAAHKSSSNTYASICHAVWLSSKSRGVVCPRNVFSLFMIDLIGGRWRMLAIRQMNNIGFDIFTKEWGSSTIPPLI